MILALRPYVNSGQSNSSPVAFFSAIPFRGFACTDCWPQLVSQTKCLRASALHKGHLGGSGKQSGAFAEK